MTNNQQPESLASVGIGSSDWLGFFSITTFLLYIVIWDIGLLVGVSYLIWWKGASGWWFLPAFILCGMSYKPKQWRELWERSSMTNVMMSNIGAFSDARKTETR